MTQARTKASALALRRQREKRGLSLAQVAARLNQSPRTSYARYEQGRAVPTVERLVELFKAVAPAAPLVLRVAEARDSADDDVNPAPAATLPPFRHPKSMHPPPLSSAARVPVEAFDLRATLLLQRFGVADPTVEQTDLTFRKSFVGANDEVVTHALRRDGESLVVAASDGDPGCWTSQFPLADGHDTFLPEHRNLRRLVARYRGLRLLRVPWLFDMCVSCILQQRVRFVDAARSFRKLALARGVRTAGGVALPPAQVLARLPLWELHSYGIDAQRARTLVSLAREESFRPFLQSREARTTSEADLVQRLSRVPGIGPWTIAMIRGFGLGSTDVVPTGDVHLPRLVAQLLGGEGPIDDAGMLQRLEPYAGMRFRVVRLVMSGIG